MLTNSNKSSLVLGSSLDFQVILIVLAFEKIFFYFVLIPNSMNTPVDGLMSRKLSVLNDFGSLGRLRCSHSLTQSFDFLDFVLPMPLLQNVFVKPLTI